VRAAQRLTEGLAERGFPPAQDPVSDALGALDSAIQARDEARASKRSALEDFAAVATAHSERATAAEAEQDALLTRIAEALGIAPKLAALVDESTIVDEAARVRRERDEAIAHDRQPYPTAWAYEQACKALEKHRAAAAAARAERDAIAATLDDLRRMMEELAKNADRVAATEPGYGDYAKFIARLVRYELRRSHKAPATTPPSADAWAEGTDRCGVCGNRKAPDGLCAYRCDELIATVADQSPPVPQEGTDTPQAVQDAAMAVVRAAEAWRDVRLRENGIPDDAPDYHQQFDTAVEDGEDALVALADAVDHWRYKTRTPQAVQDDPGARERVSGGEAKLPAEPGQFSTVRVGVRAYVRDDAILDHLHWYGPEGRCSWAEVCRMALEKTGFPPVLMVPDAPRDPKAEGSPAERSAEYFLAVYRMQAQAALNDWDAFSRNVDTTQANLVQRILRDFRHLGHSDGAATWTNREAGS